MFLIFYKVLYFGMLIIDFINCVVILVNIEILFLIVDFELLWELAIYVG